MPRFLKILIFSLFSLASLVCQAGVCDGSRLAFLNRSDSPLRISKIQTYGNSSLHLKSSSDSKNLQKDQEIAAKSTLEAFAYSGLWDGGNIAADIELLAEGSDRPITLHFYLEQQPKALEDICKIKELTNTIHPNLLIAHPTHDHDIDFIFTDAHPATDTEVPLFEY